MYYRGAQGKQSHISTCSPILSNNFYIRVLFIFLGALIVYDITDTDSFARMSTWVKELR